MKAHFKFLIPALVLVFSLVVSTPSFASIDNQIDGQYESADGVALVALPTSVNELKKLVDEKQQKAVSLITIIASEANSSQGYSQSKDEAIFAYTGFMARLEGVREEREELQRKNLSADEATLINYSKRLDHLNADLEKFLK